MSRRFMPVQATVVACAAVAWCLACSAASTSLTLYGVLPLGTWGGDNAGLIVSDTAAHLHVGCTFGDVSGRIALDANGRFDLPGRYTLRAYPVTVGPPVPARFVGQLVGTSVTVTVTVNDTVTHTTVIRGPVVVTYGEDPRMGPCPICRRPIITVRGWASSLLAGSQQRTE